MKQSLTPLQVAVIDRLRNAGYDTLADCAANAWPRGEQCNLPNMVRGRQKELRDDYEKANAQARPESQ